jgi:hypothetical protein
MQVILLQLPECSPPLVTVIASLSLRSRRPPPPYFLPEGGGPTVVVDRCVHSLEDLDVFYI